MIEYTIIIEVAGKSGENCLSISKVSNYDMEVLDPLFNDIKQHRGYYPVGSFIRSNEPSARDLYHNYIGWDVLESILPNPPSGFSTILNVSVFQEKPLKMEML